jgi:hypothetical protein
MNAFNAMRLSMLLGFGFMAVAALAIFIFKLASPRRSKSMMTEPSGIVLFLSITGILTFLAGLSLAVCGYQDLGLALAGAGLLAAFGSIFMNAARAKAKRAAWPVVSARCTDRELQKKIYNDGNDGWSWRVVCEINFAGKNYSVTPKVHWSDAGQADAPFWSEEKARHFLAQAIAPDGECKLRVNPDNPLEAELLRQHGGTE